MKKLLLNVALLGFAACSGTSGTTHQTTTPPPPVPGGSASPTIYDSGSVGSNTLPSQSSSPAPQDPAASTGSVVAYTVQPGDSLWKIANTHRTTVMKIRAANNLTGDVIRPGQVLQVPVP